ncbi:ATP-dependent DNA helicase [Peribacillus butanolivorans]|uniref:ATP-dependent DNA helicase n=1 Tax=Peribacillus butanolivorans TaxID=421767 RepID=UPI00366CD7FF
MKWVEICRQIFRQPITIIHGEAGTGKTTIHKSLINGIMKAHGEGTTFQLLAPTGKAADRLRERTGKNAETIHSFLAKRGWLNNNMTFKRSGGTVETNVTTYIIDEAAMIDVNLVATLFKAINFKTVQRLIFGGDVNQLPPIGVDKPFADILHWLKSKFPDSIGILKTNCRQLESGGISLKLASIYTEGSNVEKEINSEDVLQKVQKGGNIVKDISVVYWNDGEELKRKIYQTIISDIEEIRGEKLDPERIWEDFKILNQEDGKHSTRLSKSFHLTEEKHLVRNQLIS